MAQRLPPFLAWRSDATLGFQQGQAPKDTSNATPTPGPGPGGPTPGTQDQRTPQDPGQRPGMCLDTPTLLMMAGMFAVFYFLMIRPQQKQEKARRELLAKADKGDRVVTTSGMHGTIVSAEKDTVVLRVDSDVKLRFDRSAVARIVTDEPNKTDKGGAKDAK